MGAQGALTRLREVEHSSNAAFQAVAVTAFNPKTVTMGGLYGEYHPQTHEWQDGLASCLIRAAVADTSPAHKWQVFDGPVDCGWIENLNTVWRGQLLPKLDAPALPFASAMASACQLLKLTGVSLRCWTTTVHCACRMASAFDSMRRPCASSSRPATWRPLHQPRFHAAA